MRILSLELDHGHSLGFAVIPGEEGEDKGSFDQEEGGRQFFLGCGDGPDFGDVATDRDELGHHRLVLLVHVLPHELVLLDGHVGIVGVVFGVKAAVLFNFALLLQLQDVCQGSPDHHVRIVDRARDPVHVLTQLRDPVSPGLDVSTFVNGDFANLQEVEADLAVGSLVLAVLVVLGAFGVGVVFEDSGLADALILLHGGFDLLSLHRRVDLVFDPHQGSSNDVQHLHFIEDSGVVPDQPIAMGNKHIQQLPLEV